MLSKIFTRLFLIACLIFYNLPLWSQSSPNPLITEIQVTNADSVYRYLFLYNDNQNKTLETKYVMKNDEWKRREQIEWTYNDNLCTNQYIRKWINSQWELVHQINFTYTDNLPATETHLIFENGTYIPESKHSKVYSGQKILAEIDSNRINSAWVITSKTEYKYNVVSGNLDTLYFSKFNDGILDSQSRVDFTYNGSAQILKETYAEKQDTNWINTFQTVTYYEPSSTKKNYQIKKVWNSSIKKWENSQNITYTYNTAGYVKFETYQQWKTQFWENNMRYEYIYDTNNALTKKINYMPVFDDFRPVSSINYTDFQYGKASLIEANYEFWGGETGSCINTFIPYEFNNESEIQYGSKVKISYIPVNDTGISTLIGSGEKKQIEVYPNPSIAIFYFNTQKYDVKSWTVSDISGKIVLSKSNTNNSGVIDMGDFKSGIYLLQVKTAQGILTQKLIKK
ncbi:hypothetical protein TRIP_D310190 [uncultured Paludibacter sp.]|nr:hypothetical protein TRIP_D310190 [uncultured Paludibacter sp.]